METIKYEAVFGDQSLFNGMLPDAQFVCEEYGYAISNGKLIYCERHNQRCGWSNSFKNLNDFRPIAMRRIIKTPVWTVADQKAGRLPEVGSRIVGESPGIAYEVVNKTDCGIIVFKDNPEDNVGYYNNADVFLFFKPIETKEERAQRLRDEWCSECISKHYPRGHKGFPEMIYDALLSGELQSPKDIK